MRACLMLAAAAALTACSCFQQKTPATQAIAEAPVTSAVPATTPETMAKSAVQVIDAAEQEAAPAEGAEAKPVTAPTPGVTRCWLKSDLRTIATEQGADGRCQVVYDSAGQNHVVANKSNDVAECGRLHERLKRNLVASGFSCE